MIGIHHHCNFPEGFFSCFFTAVLGSSLLMVLPPDKKHKGEANQRGRYPTVSIILIPIVDKMLSAKIVFFLGGQYPNSSKTTTGPPF